MTDDLDFTKLPKGWKEDKMDNLILLSVLKLKEKKKNVILVSNDSNISIKADAIGVTVEEYKNDRLAEGVSAYSGRTIRHVTSEDFNKFMVDKKLSIDCLLDKELPAPLVNEFITLMTWEGSSYLAKYDGIYIRQLDYQKSHPCGLNTRNAGQIFLQEALMSPYDRHPLTICVGPAGTGKTLFAVAAGLEQVMERHTYKKVLICRPNIMMDEEIGFLPGTEQEKISPLLRGAYDNLQVLFGNKDDTQETMQDKIEELFQRGYIATQSIGYLRGRSIPETYIIIDECQNCTPNQILSIITRAGEGSKIVLLGDPNQIDNMRLDRRNNGLIYALERMKDSKLCEVTTFTESECTRSALAKEASDKLKK
jgi:PhoH-like ATPase